MIELHCAYCDRVLMEIQPGQETILKIRCRRCSALNRWSAEYPNDMELLEAGRDERVPRDRPAPSEWK
jgi:phage FluMu protein Com